MKKQFFLFFVLFLGFFQFSKSQNQMIFMFYNVENLYDIKDDPQTDDNEFLPESPKKWDSEKYEKKLQNIAKVILEIGNNENLPDFIGLCEIENREVLTDLAAQKELKKANYQIVHQNSPDKRGVDVALLYKKESFAYLEHQAIRINIPNDTSFKTRDILRVKGTLPNKEILHIFVNHWSSRREGESVTEAKRLAAAKILRQNIDSIFKFEPKAKIIICGDFNDNPDNESIFKTLRATNNTSPKDDSELFNLMFEKFKQKQGTLTHKNNWDLFDNLIVSQTFLTDKKGFHTNFEGGNIFREKFLLFENKKGEVSPSRTYGGNKYFGGFSDHLPVFVIFKLEK